MAANQDEVSFDEAKTRLDEVTQTAAKAVSPALNQFGQLQQVRAERLTLVANRLKGQLGEDHPRVLALKQRLAAVNVIGQSLNVEATRLARQPAVSPNEWLVFGRVLDPQGRPVPGLRVRVFDRDRKYDDLLGDTTTDEYGDFAVKYHERDFAEAREGLPELYVMVEDAAGKLLYSSRDNVRFKSGRSEYFEIRLTPPEAAATKSTETTQVSPRRKSK